jgi:multidrug efflux pump subunit AcrA (membrane-fusion protein)
MYAKVNMEFAKESAMLVPSSAVLQQMGTNNRYVFLYENGTAKRVEVLIGKRFDEKIEISSDQINEGSVLIISGHAGLVDGAKVKIVE